MSFVSTIIGTTERVPLPDLVVVEKEWRWSGTHYPCLWRGHSIVDAALALVLSRASPAGLFGYADGSEWGVSHYRMKAE
ncbi:hypothetical protein ACVWXO_001420 [Bradyrhizobium sp. LM2.7]